MGAVRSPEPYIEELIELKRSTTQGSHTHVADSGRSRKAHQRRARKQHDSVSSAISETQTRSTKTNHPPTTRDRARPAGPLVATSLLLTSVSSRVIVMSRCGRCPATRFTSHCGLRPSFTGHLRCPRLGSRCSLSRRVPGCRCASPLSSLRTASCVPHCRCPLAGPPLAAPPSSAALTVWCRCTPPSSFRAHPFGLSPLASDAKRPFRSRRCAFVSLRCVPARSSFRLRSGRPVTVAGRLR